ncbi:RagB/SusD family nutrient uptake outer membrane protein [Tamlana crocina]|uniref:RagB/SusD family nutrient uptake outer membrane protein n=1 Tax=Tamlana crocina TaxID=393006 RepID=A0ABX1DF43_9FLAO|nr:RagB/SusD family nutrient uptake outer membrane protein [Tamlana crocina]NJX16057.1 RagB/SusD family nutrient uptake outer membrane protein [Tamlana crocina]
MKTTKYTIIILVSFVLTGCTRDNFLDFQPKGKVIPSKIEEFRALLDQVEPDPNVNFTQGFGTHHDFTIIASDNYLLTEQVRASFGISPEEINLYLFKEQISTENGDDNNWIRYYNQIYVANVVLEGLKTVENGTPEAIAEVKADASLQRAFAYFNLVNIYSVHYNPETADTDLGVPIRDGIELEGADFTRASVAEIYDLILNDINNNIEALPDLQPANLSFRPSKAGAYAFLARVLIYQAKYEEALEAANKGLALKNSLRDINNDPVDPRDANVLAYPLAVQDEQLIWFKDSGGFTLVTTPEFYGLYDDNDQRKKWFADARTYFFAEIDNPVFVAHRANNNTNVSLTTADLYLMRAECYARLGDIELANKDLNTLRVNRFKTGAYVPVDITDQDNLIAFVKDEIRREKAMSTLRIFDIKRYNRFDNANITVTHSFNGETVSIAPNSLNWALPIATNYILANPEIEQNPRQ